MSSVEFTSDVVRNAKFRDKMRGYHPDEVDAFLERAAAALDLLQTRLAEATERVLKAETALESNSAADEGIRRTLVLAQRTAELAVSEANDEADRIRAEAEAEVDRQRSENEAACAQLVADAGVEADAQRSQAEQVLAAAQAEAQERRQASDEAIERAERQSAERISQTEKAAAAAQAEAAEAAQRQLESVVAELNIQRADLQAQVSALTEYLASERARVLDSLTTALDTFGGTLSPSPAPAMVQVAMEAPAPPPVEVVAEPESPYAEAPPEAEPEPEPEPESESEYEAMDTKWIHPEPEEEPLEEEAPVTAEWASPVEDEPEAPGAIDEWLIQAGAGAPEISNEDVPSADVSYRLQPVMPEPEVEEPTTLTTPAALLFTLEDDMRREIDANEAVAETKARKSLLGRRRS